LDALTQAIVLNGASAAQNRQALDIGRLAAVAPEKIAAFIAEIAKPLSPPPATDLDTIIAERARYLAAYQNKSYAKRFTELVAKARAAEHALAPKTQRFTEAVARGAFAAMLIKDEYEVARLLTAPDFQKQIANQFAGDYKVSYNLAPSWLAKRADGAEPAKRVFGPWLAPVLKVASKFKFLRETALDPFNADPLRRRERALRDAYIARIEDLIARLAPANLETATKIAALPTEIRGYGHVKEKAIAKAEAKLQDLSAQVARVN
jgi:indolepyruvate ferredoxin oxidoreductase